MTTVALADLTSPDTPDDVFRVLLSLLASAGFPVESWLPGEPSVTLLEVESDVYADLTTVVSLIAKGGYVDLAEKEWLTLLAKGFYALDREPATFTQGKARLLDGGGGPHTITPRQLTAESDDGLLFTNVDGGTLLQNNTLTLTWEAEAAGAAYNVPAGALRRLKTTLPTVAIDNPIVIATGTWITQAGADEEPDATLRQRCKARWPELGTGATGLVYRKWALEASTEVTRVSALENPVTSDGIVTLWLAGANGPVGSGAVAAVNDYVQPRRPLTVRVDVASAAGRNVDVDATLYVQAAYANEETVAGQVAAALTAFGAGLAIGATVYRSALVELLMGVNGATNVVLTSPATDVILDANEIATFTRDLTVVPS
jgi:phage-related baseplate assembly protein